MNLTICLSAAFLILSHAAFCMPIRGQVKAGNKGLSHVVITDGINFTRQTQKGISYSTPTRKPVSFTS